MCLSETVASANEKLGYPQGVLTKQMNVADHVVKVC